MTIKSLDISTTTPADGVRAEKSAFRAKWTEIKGKYEALAAQALRYRGTWAAGTFLSGDVVSSDGAWYYASSNLTTEVPGAAAAWTPLFFVPKTAAEWAASSYILPENIFGLATDTGVLKVGNGTDVFNSLTVSIEGDGDGHAAVTLSSALSATISASRDLVSSDTTTALSAQELALGRFRFVTSASAAVTLVLADTLAVSDTIELFVINDDNTLTIARPSVSEEGTGTTNGTDTVSMADTSMVRLADVVSGTSVTGGQTVIDITPNTSIQLSAVANGSQADDTLTFSGKRGVFNGSEADVTLRKGFVAIKVIGTSVGIDAEVIGATNQGFDGILAVYATAASVAFGPSNLGKMTELAGTTAAQQSAQIDTPENMGAAWGQNGVRSRMEIFCNPDAAATSFVISPTGDADANTFLRPAADSLTIARGGFAVLTAASATKWALAGNMVAV